MRNLQRYTVKIHYALYLGQTPILDNDLNETGTFAPLYSEPFSEYATVSPARGNAYASDFGAALDYDKTVIGEGKCPFDEKSRLWVDRGISDPYDYEVVRIAQSPNFWQTAIKHSDVS